MLSHRNSGMSTYPSVDTKKTVKIDSFSKLLMDALKTLPPAKSKRFCFKTLHRAITYNAQIQQDSVNKWIDYFSIIRSFSSNTKLPNSVPKNVKKLPNKHILPKCDNIAKSSYTE